MNCTQQNQYSKDKMCARYIMTCNMKWFASAANPTKQAPLSDLKDVIENIRTVFKMSSSHLLDISSTLFS